MAAMREDQRHPVRFDASDRSQVLVSLDLYLKVPCTRASPGL